MEDVTFVPLDVAALDGALAGGRTLAEGAPASPARTALAALAASIAGVPRAQRRRGLLRRRRTG
jgi:Flp pilus assembly CpaE family ATPase